MLDKLKAKRDELVLAKNSVEAEDLISLIAERVEAYRQKAIEEVNAEHEARVNAIKEKVEHYDFVINALEEEAKEVNEEVGEF